MSKCKEQEVLDKILESCQDEIERAVKKSFYDYIIYGESIYEMHADGLKEVCKFCPPDEQCGRPWCPYTEEE